MEKKIAILLVLALFLTARPVAAAYTEFLLAHFPLTSNMPYKTAVFENQIAEIDKTFGLNADLTELRENATSGMGMRADNGLVTRITTEMPETGIEYTIIRNGMEMNETSTTLMVGDSIEFKPQADIPQDWVHVGANMDTPPIQFTGGTAFTSLYDKLSSEFSKKYPFGSSSALDGVFQVNQAPPQQIEKFSTQITSFNEQESYYTANNGYQAYLLPIASGRKAGIQIICSNKAYGENLECTGMGDTLRCTVQKSGALAININFMREQCLVHVDKIIEGSTAIDAGWIAKLANVIRPHPSHLYKLELQVIPQGKKPPIAEFDCKVLKKPLVALWGEIECNALASHDPDGTIKQYEWDKTTLVPYNRGPTYKKSVLGTAPQTITLRVYDNEEFYGEKTKTFNFSGGTLQEVSPAKTLTFTADYKDQKALLTLSNCPFGVIQAYIDIDLLDSTGKPGLSVLEKQPIDCDATTEVGPITAPGCYLATAKIGDKTIPANPFCFK